MIHGSGLSKKNFLNFIYLFDLTYSDNTFKYTVYRDQILGKMHKSSKDKKVSNT